MQTRHLRIASLAVLPLVVTFGSLGLGRLLLPDADPSSTPAPPASATTADAPADLRLPADALDDELAWFHDPAVPLPTGAIKTTAQGTSAPPADPETAAALLRVIQSFQPHRPIHPDHLRLVITGQDLGDAMRARVNATAFRVLHDAAPGALAGVIETN